MLLCKRSPYELPTGVAAAKCLYSCWEFVGDVKIPLCITSEWKARGCMSGESTVWFFKYCREWEYPAGSLELRPELHRLPEYKPGKIGEERGSLWPSEAPPECPPCAALLPSLSCSEAFSFADTSLDGSRGDTARAFFPAITRSKSSRLRFIGRAAPMFWGLILRCRIGWAMPSIFLKFSSLTWWAFPDLESGSGYFLGADMVMGDTRQALGWQSRLWLFRTWNWEPALLSWGPGDECARPRTLPVGLCGFLGRLKSVGWSSVAVSAAADFLSCRWKDAR